MRLLSSRRQRKSAAAVCSLMAVNVYMCIGIPWQLNGGVTNQLSRDAQQRIVATVEKERRSAFVELLLYISIRGLSGCVGACIIHMVRWVGLRLCAGCGYWRLSCSGWARGVDVSSYYVD